MEETPTRGAGGGVPRDWLPDVDGASSFTCGAVKLSLLEYFEYFWEDISPGSSPPKCLDEDEETDGLRWN